MRGKIFATVAAILALCLTCAGCFDSDEPEGRRTRTKTESANVVPNDECAQVLALYLDQQLLFKNEPTKHAPAYFIDREGVFNPPEMNLFLNVASKDCLTASLRGIELCSSLGHSRYLTYEQIAQIADKFADLQKRCSYKIECTGAPNVPTDKWPKYLRSAKVYNVTITAPDMAAIEQLIFNGVKSEYLKKLPAADKEADFTNYYNMILFNERDLVHLDDYNPPGHHEVSLDPLNTTVWENPQNHRGVLWVHYAVDKDVVGKMIFDQFMNTLEKPEKLPTRKIELQLLLAPYHDDRIPEICTLVEIKKEDLEDGLPALVWEGFGKTFSSASHVLWNRPKVKTPDGKLEETIFDARLGMYVSKNGEDAPHGKDVIVTDGNQKFRGVELENVSIAVCDIKERILQRSGSENPYIPGYEQREFTVTLLVDNASDENFVAPWIRVIDEYGDHLRSYHDPIVKAHSKEKFTLTADTGLFFTNEITHPSFILKGWQKHTAGYDPNTEKFIDDDKGVNKKFVDLKKWQEANNLHVYEMPKNYFVKYGRLLIPVKVSSAD